MTKPAVLPASDVVPRSPMLTGLNKLIELLEAQERELASAGAPEEATRGVPGATRSVPEAGVLAEQMEDLDIFLHRLRQIRDWIKQDPRLLPVVDDAIGKQVRALERRQTRQNIILAAVTTVAGAILGWLISLLGTPITAWHALLH